MRKKINMSHFYKNIREIEVKVGFFVIICLLILFLSYSWLLNWFLGNKYITVKVIFDSVGSLEKGHSVYYRGVLVGRVRSMEITNDGVLVNLYVEKGTNFQTTDLFYVKDKDMMGTKMVDVVPGKIPKPLINQSIYQGQNIPGLADLVAKFNYLTEYLEVFIAKIESNGELFAQLEKIINRVDQSLIGAQGIIDDLNKSDLLLSFTELKKASSSIVELTEGLAEPLDTAFTQIDSFITTTQILVNSIQKNLDNEDSNFNKIFNDEELYNNLVDSTKEVKFLLEDIKENPKKYFKFSVF